MTQMGSLGEIRKQVYNLKLTSPEWKEFEITGIIAMGLRSAAVFEVVENLLGVKEAAVHRLVPRCCMLLDD